MTPEEFEECFERATRSVFRLEALQRYTVDAEAPKIEAFRRGAPRPDRSVRTSPWLRRIAVTTAAGLHWSRVHIVELPLSEYVTYELQGYVESAAAGEEIGLALRGEHAELGALRQDFWLFDEGSAEPYAIAMNYDDAGRPLDHELVADPALIAQYAQIKETVWRTAVPLNVFLATQHHYHQAKSA